MSQLVIQIADQVNRVNFNSLSISSSPQYQLKGNPAGTAVLIVNKARDYIDSDIKLSKDIFKLLLGSATECKVIEATSPQVCMYS